MPLRDHFRPPLDLMTSWEGLHGQWPAVIVQQLRKRLPAGYVAEPRIRTGPPVEDHAAASTKDKVPPPSVMTDQNGVTPTTVRAPAWPDDEYQVRIYNARRGRHLVATIELVSPANKDRPEHRNLFVTKCVALLEKSVSVSIIDVVTTMPFNLYLDLRSAIGHDDPTLGDPPPHLYGGSCRWIPHGPQTVLEAWSHALNLGESLPILPLSLSPDIWVPLSLEQSYEQACDDLWIS